MPSGAWTWQFSNKLKNAAEVGWDTQVELVPREWQASKRGWRSHCHHVSADVGTTQGCVNCGEIDTGVIETWSGKAVFQGCHTEIICKNCAILRHVLWCPANRLEWWPERFLRENQKRAGGFENIDSELSLSAVLKWSQRLALKRSEKSI